MQKKLINGKWVYPEPPGRKVVVLKEGERHPRAKGSFIKNREFEKQEAFMKFRQPVKR